MCKPECTEESKVKILYLPLKREYFDAIKAGTKKFEYRRASKHWEARIDGKSFDKIVLTLGYPKGKDKSRRLVRPWRGYVRRRITHPEFGNESVMVYAVRVNPEITKEQ